MSDKDEELSPEVEAAVSKSEVEILEQSTTITTLTRMTFPDGKVEDIEIAHFEPEDQAVIEKGISNRLISELRNRGYTPDEVKAAPDLVILR